MPVLPMPSPSCQVETRKVRAGAAEHMRNLCSACSAVGGSLHPHPLPPLPPPLPTRGLERLFLLGSVSVADSPARHLCFAVCGNLNGDLIDAGYPDSFRGWYDFSGCGTCNDYCRWVGNSGSGGDPSVRQTYGSSFWSCANRDDSYPTHGWDTQLSKCSERGAPTPLGRLLGELISHTGT